MVTQQTELSLLCTNYFLNLFQFAPILPDFDLLLIHLRDDALCEIDFLRLDHFMSDRADVKQTEDVDLEDL